MFWFRRKPGPPEEAPPSARCPEHGVEAPLLREEAAVGGARQAVYAHAYHDAGIPITHEFKVALAASQRAAARSA